MAFEDLYSAPATGMANSYTMQAHEETGFFANAGNFITSTVIASGADMYNSSGAIIKFFGADGWHTDTHAMIDSYDAEAGQYYQANKGLVDGAELLATSLIGYGIGIKGLRAVQAGASGSRILSTLGFDTINPTTLNAARAAAADKASQVSSTWNAMNGELGKALALGVASNTLDMAAGGLASLAANNASPLYDGMSATDLLKNTAFDSLILGGVIGGAFSAGKTYLTVKNAAHVADLKLLPARGINVGDSRMDSWTNIATTIGSYAENLAKIKGSAVMPADTISAVNRHVRSLVEAEIPDSQAKLRKSVGDLAVQFINNPDERSLGAEAANFFAKLKSVGHIPQTGELTGQQLVVDASTGSILKDLQSTVFHLGDIPNIDILSKEGEVVVGVTREGQANLSWIANGNIQDASAMQATYLKAARTSRIPEVVKLVESNIPMAERAYEEAVLAKTAGKGLPAEFSGRDGLPLTSVEEIGAELREVKREAIETLVTEGLETPEQIAARVNVSTKFIDSYKTAPLSLHSVSGKLSGMQSIDSFIIHPRNLALTYDIGSTQALKSTGETKEILNKFIRSNAGKAEDVFNTSLQGGMFKERLVTTPMHGATTAIYEQQASAYLENVANVHREMRKLVSETVVPELNGLATFEEDLLDQLGTATRSEVGTATLLKSADNNPGSLGSIIQKMGSIIEHLSSKAVRKVTAELGASAHIIANDAEIGREHILIQQKLHTTEATYVVPSSGEKFLLRQDIAINNVRAEANNAAEAAGQKKPYPQFVEELKGPAKIDVSERYMNEVVIPHAEKNSKILQNRLYVDNQFMPGSSGNAAISHGLVPYYAIPFNTANYKHFVFVRDSSRLIGNGSGSAMLMAKDAEQLAAKQAKLELAYPNRFEFLTKKDTESYYKTMGEYSYDRGLNENFANSAMRREGVLGDLIPNTSKDAMKEAADDFLSFHQRAATREIRDAVELRNAEAIQRIKFLGQQLEDTAKSELTGTKLAAFNADTVSNPYKDMVNMAMNRSNASEYPLWMEGNAFLEKSGDKVFDAVRNTWKSLVERKLTGPVLDAEVAALNKAAVKAGLEPLYTNLMVAAQKDQLAIRPMLRRTIAKTQAVLNGIMLGFDPMQAINNSLGQVMWAAEFKSLLSQIEKADPKAGALTGLAKVQIPGMEYSITSAVKIHAQVSKEFFSGGQVWDEVAGSWKQATRDELIAEYKAHGILSSLSEQHAQLLDNITASGRTATDAELARLTESILDGGRKISGNALAEEYTRFVAAHAARKLTDAAMSLGLIDNKALASVYWNTAVNRVHGINIASQRAVIFQGVIGQSIGMFMTYQHNLMQQLFRYSSEGNTIAMAALATSQLGLYGVQGLPAFNAVSTHIVGNAWGNTDHADPYSFIAKNANMQLPAGAGSAAEWILYGAGSNALGLVHPDLKMNLYSRGDINPRQLTLFPIAVTDTIAYKSTISVVKNMYDMLDNFAGGAPAKQALLHGIEHNGINRPLSGLGSVLQGAQTSTAGTVIGDVGGGVTGDFFDKLAVSNYVRIAGAKPLDDAAAADAMYRVTAYQAKTRSDIKNLAETMRVAQIGKEQPTPEAMQNFMQQYAKLGGDIRSFRGFAAKTFMTANSNTVADFAMKMRSPGAKQVAAILGATHDEVWMSGTGED